MLTFTLFPQLPTELRAQIWASTVEPRTVELRFLKRRDAPGGRLTSATPVPSVLQACREARYARLYKQEFAEDTAGRYIWLNLDIDIISIGQTHLYAFDRIAHQIKRLQLARYNTDDGWHYYEARRLRGFTNCAELYVVCLDGYYEWSGCNSVVWLKDKCFFLDPKDLDRRWMTLAELNVRYVRRWKRWEMQCAYEHPEWYEDC